MTRNRVTILAEGRLTPLVSVPTAFAHSTPPRAARDRLSGRPVSPRGARSGTGGDCYRMVSGDAASRSANRVSTGKPSARLST